MGGGDRRAAGTDAGIDGFHPLVPSADLYAALAALHEQGPVHAFDGLTLVTGYDDVAALLRDTTAFSNNSPRVAADGEEQHIAHLDGEAHARQRRLVNQAFTEKAVRPWAARIAAIASELIDDFADERGEVDLVERFSGPLPAIVFAELFGVAPEQRRQFLRWSDDAIEHATSPGGAPTKEEFGAWIRAQVDARRAAPGDDLLGRLVRAHEDDDRLTESELHSLVRILVIAGTETTANLVATLVHQLLANAGAWARVRDDRSLVRSSIEEALRIDPPLSWVPRLARDGAAAGGQPLPAGTFVGACLAHANRDASVFADPDRFDPNRFGVERDRGFPHLAFGYGAHFCVGAPLARLEATIALDLLLDRFPRLQLVQGYAFEPRGPLMMRGCRTLPVHLRPTA